VQPPAAPTNLRSDNVTHNSLTFRWNAAARATHYTVYRWSNNNWVQQGSSTTSLSRNFTGLASNTWHRFAVRAHNASGSTWSQFYHGRWTNPVPASTIPATGVTLSPSSLTLTVGDRGGFAATVSPSNAINRTVTWSSSNISVAGVTSTGMIIANNAGTATITARTHNGRTASRQVTVRAPVSGPIIRTTTPAQNITQMLIPNYGNGINFNVTADSATRVHIYLNGFLIQWSTRTNNGVVSALTSARFDRPGSHVIRFVAWNAAGASTSVSRTVTITPLTVNSLVVYQSPRHPGRVAGPGSAIADDMRFNNYSLDQLRNISSNLRSQAVRYRNNPQAVRNDARNLADLFSWQCFDRMIVARRMFDHFISGSGTVFSNGVLNLFAFSHPSTVRFVNLSETEIVAYIRRNRGAPGGARNDARVVRELNAVRPMFNRSEDMFNGMSIMVHDTWGRTVTLRNYTFDGRNFSGTLRISIYDHFGLDTDDIRGYGSLMWVLENVMNHNGFSSWYVLQHYRGTNNRYRPFITWMERDIEFSGTI